MTKSEMRAYAKRNNMTLKEVRDMNRKNAANDNGNYMTPEPVVLFEDIMSSVGICTGGISIITPFGLSNKRIGLTGFECYGENGDLPFLSANTNIGSSFIPTRLVMGSNGLKGWFVCVGTDLNDDRCPEVKMTIISPVKPNREMIRKSYFSLVRQVVSRNPDYNDYFL